MARDRANIRIDMWADQDWRELTGEAQRLYMQLLSSPTLNYAGVADWYPGRLAAMAADLTAGSIERAGTELVRRFFIVIDEDMSEVLIRSFVKHDGLLKQPKLVVSMTNAYAAVASGTLRTVIAFEIQKMHDREPDLVAWKVKQTETILKAAAVDAHSLSSTVTPLFTPDLTQSVTPGLTPSDGQSQGLPTSTATTTSTKRESTANRGARLTPAWVVTAELQKWAVENAPHVDLRFETEKFRNYWIAKPGKDGVKLDWDATWRNWILRVRDDYAKNAPATPKRRFVAHAD